MVANSREPSGSWRFSSGVAASKRRSPRPPRAATSRTSSTSSSSVSTTGAPGGGCRRAASATPARSRGCGCRSRRRSSSSGWIRPSPKTASSTASESASSARGVNGFSPRPSSDDASSSSCRASRRRPSWRSSARIEPAAARPRHGRCDRRPAAHRRRGRAVGPRPDRGGLTSSVTMTLRRRLRLRLRRRRGIGGLAGRSAGPRQLLRQRPDRGRPTRATRPHGCGGVSLARHRHRRG